MKLLNAKFVFQCFSEIINIGYAVYKMDNLPWFRSLSWYFLIASNYFFYGETLVEQFGVVINRVDFLPILVKYHRLISFSMYIMGETFGFDLDCQIILFLLKVLSGLFFRLLRNITSASSRCLPGLTWRCCAW